MHCILYFSTSCLIRLAISSLGVASEAETTSISSGGEHSMCTVKKSHATPLSGGDEPIAILKAKVLSQTRAVDISFVEHGQIAGVKLQL